MAPEQLGDACAMLLSDRQSDLREAASHEASTRWVWRGCCDITVVRRGLAALVIRVMFKRWLVAAEHTHLHHSRPQQVERGRRGESARVYCDAAPGARPPKINRHQTSHCVGGCSDASSAMTMRLLSSASRALACQRMRGSCDSM